MNKLLLALALAASAGVAACGPSYSHTDIDQVSTNDLPATITAGAVSVTVGGVVTAHIEPYNSNNDALSGDVVSSDPSILDIKHATGDRIYAFVGVKEGSTTVQLYADGNVVGTLQAQVVAQPAAQ